MSEMCDPGQGGKGNRAMFIDRSPNVIAAGLPTKQASEHVAEQLEHYLLQDEVDALIGDALPPKPKPKPRPPLRRQPLPDGRNAGPYNEVRNVINPPTKTKLQLLVDDLRSTAYSSYWKMSLGQTRDQVPMLPAGFDKNTTFGKKTAYHGRLYDIVLPVNPLPGKSSPSKAPSYQTDRNYDWPYDPNTIFGMKTTKDTRGRYLKCCVTDDRFTTGTCRAKPINVLQANFNECYQSSLGLPRTPNNNINCVPPDHTFGILKPPDSGPGYLSRCPMNIGRQFLLTCLKHLNTVRKALSKRLEPTFFDKFYLNLKYLDKNKSGWLPKKSVYDLCATKFIRFDPTLIEPLLELWNAFDGSCIEYKIFVRVINYRVPSPDMPKIMDFPVDCCSYDTTYSDMVKLGQKADDRHRAGLPSGRYLDLDYPITPIGCCKADEAYLPQESDAKACLIPSVLALEGVSHRDMYARQSPEVIRKVFEAAGEQFPKEKFDVVWNEAKQYHSQGWVSYETFRRALIKVDAEMRASNN